MKLDLGSFAFGSNVPVGGNPSWGTALGQGKGLKFTTPGWENILAGMMYKAIPTNKVFMPIGKGGHVYSGLEDDGIQLAALFDQVYINEVRVPAPFVMVIYRDSSTSWDGRRTLKYGDKIEYQVDDNTRIKNADFIAAAREALQLSDDADWIISDLYIEDQEVLHMFAGIVNPQESTTYPSTDARKAAWIEAIKHTLSESSVYKKYLAGEEISTLHNGAQNSLQKIFFGAPGTGKSHEVKRLTKELLDNGEKVDLPNVFRTTFHPDTDYASFVGCYKPTMKPTSKEEKTLTGKDEEIVYEYVPQVFTDAYVYAYSNPTEKTYLVIEEINRGNCAQIFGDLFQLLDRKNGVSEYTIKADKDLAKHLVDVLGEDFAGIKDGKLCLPDNLHILATMNTSDQSLFPMDSAFKRRWEWEYVPINYGDDIPSGSFEITIDDKTYPWVAFIQKVNEKIFDLTQSEDKQMGNFFIKSSIGEDEFKSKVMFYLWYEVLRDETGNNKYFFNTVEGKPFTFKDLYAANAKETIKQFMEYLGVPAK